jgi:hypothetical protein
MFGLSGDGGQRILTDEQWAVLARLLEERRPHAKVPPKDRLRSGSVPRRGSGASALLASIASCLRPGSKRFSLLI